MTAPAPGTPGGAAGGSPLAFPAAAATPVLPLAGITVIDLTRVLAGPFAALLLADLGARVIKVERPDGGDDARGFGPFVDGQSLYFTRVNRGKESVALDLRDPVDRAVLHRMLAGADVLVENFRPGVLARLDLAPADLLTRYPALVVTSVSGFGQTGPWSQRPAYDAVVQAMAGVMSITGSPDGPPVKPGVPLADLSAGLYAAVGTLAALLGRSQPGFRGRHVDIAMFDATVSLLEGAALSYLATGTAPPRIGNAHFAIAPFDTFRCADREITICAANDALFGVLVATLGRPGLASDPRFADNRGRHQHRAALTTELEAALATGTAATWLDRLGAAGVPCGPVSDVAEAVGSAQVAARRMVVVAGGVPAPGNPVKLRGLPDPIERAGAPALDEHGAAVRAEFGGPAG